MMQLTKLLLLRKLRNRPTLTPPHMAMALRRKQHRIVTISTPSDCSSVFPSVCPFIRMEQRVSMNRIFVKFHTGVFSQVFNFQLKICTKIVRRSNYVCDSVSPLQVFITERVCVLCGVKAEAKESFEQLNETIEHDCIQIAPLAITRLLKYIDYSRL